MCMYVRFSMLLVRIASSAAANNVTMPAKMNVRLCTYLVFLVWSSQTIETRLQ